MDSRDKQPCLGWWRSSKTPSVAVPFGARSVGRADFQPGWVHQDGTIGWTNLYWGVSGEVCLKTNSRPCVIRENYLAMHPPGTRIEGCPNPKAGAFRWLTVDGPLAAKIVQAFGFRPLKPAYAGRCPVELFDQLEKEIQDASAAGEYRATVTAYEILTRGARGPQLNPAADRTGRLVDACLQRIQDQYTQPDFNVDRLASQLGTHRSLLTRHFSQAVGLPPSRYIYNVRIRRALSLLKDPRRTIRQIAFACGFSDPAYFSRCLSREMGLTPRQIREKLM